MSLILYENTYIHPTAIIEPGAIIGEGSYIGPYSIIGANVIIGKKCQIFSHVVIEGNTKIGDNNRFFPFCVVGTEPQDKKYKGEITEVIIGNNNIFREGVTVNRGTGYSNGKTIIGNNNIFMAYSHIAHDCHIGSNVTLANGVFLAGHSIVEDYVVFGGYVGVGQFVRIGKYGMISAGSMVERDTPPYCIVGGDRATPKGINIVGLKRAGFDTKVIKELKLVFRKGYINKSERMSELKSILNTEPAIELLNFIEKNRIVI